VDVIWFEEPVSSDDHLGLRRVRDSVDRDVAAGEYGDGSIRPADAPGRGVAVREPDLAAYRVA
jgi:L-alanine-DL-glutamate epimerase-like enolase superfamily enzyme